MELGQHLSLGLYCRFLIDLAEYVKADLGFLTCEVWGGGKCFPSQNGRASLFTAQLLGFAMEIIKASLANQIMPFMLQNEQRPDHTRQLGCSHTNLCVQSHCCRPTAPSILLLGSPGAAGKDISKMLLCFHPDQARPGIYSMGWALLPPPGGCSALMRVQPSPTHRTCWQQEGKGSTGTCSNVLSSLLKVRIYIGLPSSSAADRWSQQCLLATCRIYVFVALPCTGYIWVAFSAQKKFSPHLGRGCRRREAWKSFQVLCLLLCTCNDFTSGSSVYRDLVFCSVKNIHYKKEKVNMQSRAESNNT